MLTLQNVSKTYEHHQVLTDMTFEIPSGKIIGLIGPNGAGKTTLIRIMNGVITPSSGTVHYHGESIDTLRTKAGVVTESAGLYPDMTALENLQFYASLYGVKEKERAHELLRQFDLEHVSDTLVHTFSTGMKKRLALAKAMLHHPEILFLDEPTNGLDPDGIRQVLDMIRLVNQTQGTTVIITSHLLYQLENVCDTYLFIEQGVLIEQGTLSDLRRRHQSSITVQIRTNATLQKDQSLLGFTGKQIDEEVIQITFENEQFITPFLKELIAFGYTVTECRIVGNDLEDIYFKLREDSL